MTDEPHALRNGHFFDRGPKAVLSLDGGGVRGIVSIAFLERIEAVLEQEVGHAVRLCEAFDLVGGTSTGAIIASGLALGLRAQEIKAFYIKMAPKIFRRSLWRFAIWRAKFDADHLRQELQDILGERTLDSPDLLTGLGIVTKRLDTGSAWIVSNNPRGRYWDDATAGPRLGNRRFRLSHVVRASAAAPHFFDPELIQLTQTGLSGLFVDGAVTPHNNPALSLLMLVLLPQHGISWRMGADDLCLVSLGTGSFRAKLSWEQARRSGAIGLAISALSAMISDNQISTLGLTQALSRNHTPWIINSEVGDMSGLDLPGGPLFESARYDILLEQDWLQRELGRSFSTVQIGSLRQLDEAANVDLLYELARKAAQKQVSADHLGLVVDRLKSRETTA